MPAEAVVNYKVVSSGTPEGLEKQVEALLADGWKCQGGLAISECAWSYENSKGDNTGFSATFAQAMVK